MLHMKLEEFNISAFDYPITIYGSNKEQVHAAFNSLFMYFLNSEDPLDGKQLGLLEEMLNEYVVEYE